MTDEILTSAWTVDSSRSIRMELLHCRYRSRSILLASSSPKLFLNRPCRCRWLYSSQKRTPYPLLVSLCDELQLLRSFQLLSEEHIPGSIHSEHASFKDYHQESVTNSEDLNLVFLFLSWIFGVREKKICNVLLRRNCFRFCHFPFRFWFSFSRNKNNEMLKAAPFIFFFLVHNNEKFKIRYTSAWDVPVSAPFAKPFSKQYAKQVFFWLGKKNLIFEI